MGGKSRARATAADRSVRSTLKRKRPSRFLSMAFIYAGNYLLSHTLSRAVPSAQRGLTSVFGMGTGGTPAVRSPTTWSSFGLRAVSFEPAIPAHELDAQRRQRLAANFQRA